MNNNLKKIVWMMIGIVFLAVMTACSGEDDNQTSGSGDGSTTDGANEQVLNLSKKTALLQWIRRWQQMNFLFNSLVPQWKVCTV